MAIRGNTMHIDNRVIEVADSKTDVQYDPRGCYTSAAALVAPLVHRAVALLLQFCITYSLSMVWFHARE